MHQTIDSFQKLDVLHGRQLGDETVEGGDKIILECKPMSDFLSIQRIVTSYRTLIEKIQMATDFTLGKQVIIF